ncbi:MAG: hypothetical protein E7G24_10080 [Clostridium celatum]|nr:hypothetical protein [Clostridium celatum]
MTVVVNYPEDLTEVKEKLLDFMVEYTYSILKPQEIEALIEHGDEVLAMEENKK